MKRFLITAAFFAFFTPISRAQANGLAWAEPRGVYAAPIKVSIEAGKSDAAILFSTDGSVPSVESRNRYVQPLTIRTTTVLRAVLVRGGQLVGAPETHTYLFPGDIIKQRGSGFPSTWGTNNGSTVPADYEMDPEIVSAPEYRDRIQESLKAIPSVSLVLAPEDLFGEARGIYAHPQESGDGWEHPASFEFMTADAKGNFQLNCGVRIQGGWNRRPEESPKHSFRVVFKKKYGPGKLHHSLFGVEGPKEFDTLILRSGCNNTWLHWSGTERRLGEFIRDQWMRDTLRAMGQPSAAGLFVHLYLNGLYWGLYNLTERPDAAFAATHFGGSPKDYDAFNAGKLLEGSRDAWNELMRRINRGVKTHQDFVSVAELLDLENFVDYMVANFYGANADWDRQSNWYAVRGHNPPGKFKFFVWDAERTLEQVNDNTIAFDDDQSPPRIFHRLSENPEFRRLFSQRAARHLLNDGVLTPARSGDRYRKWAESLDLAVIAESARWGDYRRDAHRYKEGPYELYTRDIHWKPEVNRLLDDYFPRRTAVVIEQFRARGLLMDPSSATE